MARRGSHFGPTCSRGRCEKPLRNRSVACRQLNRAMKMIFNLRGKAVPSPSAGARAVKERRRPAASTNRRARFDIDPRSISLENPLQNDKSCPRKGEPQLRENPPQQSQVTSQITRYHPPLMSRLRQRSRVRPSRRLHSVTNNCAPGSLDRP